MNLNRRLYFIAAMYVLLCSTGWIHYHSVHASPPVGLAAPVVATPQVSAHSVQVAWTASVSSGVTGYNVYAASVSGGPYTKRNNAAVSGLSYVDTAVTSGQKILYVVTALSAAGESVHSNEVSVTIPTSTATLAISTSSVPSGVIGVFYSSVMVATGGVPPYTWTGTGVSGLSMNASTGLLSGTPTTAGTFVESVTVTDSTQTKIAKTFNITIAGVVQPPPPVTISINPTTVSMETGATLQFIANVQNTSNTSVTWSTTVGVVSATGLFTAPTAAGTSTVTATSTADPTKSASASIAITVPAPPPATGLPKVGDRIKVTANANIRATAVAGSTGWGTILGVAPAGSLATVVVAPTVKASTFYWTGIKIDSCVSTIPNCTGYMGSDNMTVVTVTPPPPPPSATLKITCVPGASGSRASTCTIVGANMPAATSFTINGAAGGLNATATGTLP